MTFRSLAGTRDLYGVAKTLRKLYPPPQEPSVAIERALEALAFLEAQRALRPKRRPAFASVA